MAFIKLLLYALESTEEFNHIKRQNSVLIVTLNYIHQDECKKKNTICKIITTLYTGCFARLPVLDCDLFSAADTDTWLCVCSVLGTN